MKIVVSGATGFVGSRLSERLRQANHQVVALTRNADTAKSKVPSLEAAHAWSPLSESAPAAAFDGAEAVVHLAGESVVGRWTQAKRDAIRETRVIGTRNLVNGLRDLPNKPKVLVAASAVGFYGDRADEELTETSGSGDDFLSEVCREWEAEASKAEELGIKVAHVRIGVVLAEGGGALDAMLTPFKLGAGGPLGSGRQWWSWIHRDDLCGLILHLIERGESGIYNGTGPQPIRQKEFAARASCPRPLSPSRSFWVVSRRNCCRARRFSRRQHRPRASPTSSPNLSPPCARHSIAESVLNRAEIKPTPTPASHPRSRVGCLIQ